MPIRRNHYLEQRGYRWYYVRRVPSRYQVIDTRRTIKVALHTDSLIIARERRDIILLRLQANTSVVQSNVLNGDIKCCRP